MEAYRIGVLNDEIIPPGEGEWPFHRPNQNDGYASFLARARRRNLPLILANHDDYMDGRVRRGWIHDGLRYIGLGDVPLAAVYDQFPSTTPMGRALVEDIQSRGLRVFNDPKLTLVVDDKLLSYINFKDLIPFTSYFHAGHDDPREAVDRFLQGCRENGFGDIEAFVAKEQTGWGARNLYRFEQGNLGDIYHIPPGEYVLQPFLESSAGIPELGVRGRHDFRILLESGRFLTGLIRQPARHDWAANYFNAEELIFIHREDQVPKDFLDAARSADARLAEFFPRLVSFDLARLDDGRIVCWEMNSRPGMCADSNRPDDQLSSGDLQEGILDALEVIVGRS